MNSPANLNSKILLDECFEAEDPNFLNTLGDFTHYPLLKSFVLKWVEDRRPWAREQIAAYLHGTQNLPGHEVVFKRLFKHFQYAKDHEMMAHFMVATDRLVRRSRINSYRYSWKTQTSWQEERLFAKPNKSVPNASSSVKQGVNPRTGKPLQYNVPPTRNKSSNRIFTGATRNHLRRRLWRYFRFLSHQSPEKYRMAITVALAHYEDADLATGENILDNWSLMHCCYFHHPCLEFGADHTNLAEGTSLGELTASPYNPEVWQDVAAFPLLVDVLMSARSTLVRLWAIELLQHVHAERLQELDIDILLNMLAHSDPQVQEFGSDLFAAHKNLASLDLAIWLQIIHESDPSVLPVLCDAMRQHVTADRLSNEQLIELCCARPTSVAQLGFEMTQERQSRTPFSSQQLRPLANPECEQLSGELARWATSILGTPERYDIDIQIEFFDSPLAPVRGIALDWLFTSASPGFGDPAIWVRLMESPYDDIHLRMVDFLAKRVACPQVEASELATVWSSIILNIQRGNRTKLKAVRQVAEAIAKDASLADRLFPIIAVAVRSIRGPEKRNALSAVVGIAVSDQHLREKVSQYLPELEWIEQVGS